MVTRMYENEMKMKINVCGKTYNVGYSSVDMYKTMLNMKLYSFLLHWL